MTNAYATRVQKPIFIREINGLRVIAAFIVLAAHYSTISGLTSGISLFFVITGFLSGAKIKRAIAAGEKLNFWPDVRSSLWRLLLPMHLVLLAISIWILSSVDVMHRAAWMKSIFAMSLGYGNIYEVANTSDYWNRETILSPSMSLWAMSVLVQYAVILGVVRYVISRLLIKMSPSTRQISFIAIGALALVLSILDAIMFDGTTAYHFSTINWTWAFLVGLVIGGMNWRYGKRKFEMRIAEVLFFIIFVLGILPIFGLEPIGSWIRFAFAVLAAITLLAPTSGETFFQQILNTEFMQKLGFLTFGIYLIHWPLMIIYRYYTDANRDRLIPNFVTQHNLAENNQMNIYSALGLTLLSIGLAWALQKLVDLIVNKVGGLAEPKRAMVQIGSFALVPLLVFTQQSANLEGSSDVYKDLVPSLETAVQDIPSYVRYDCQPGVVEICNYGNQNADKTIVIVGTSTAGQWFDAVIPSADKYNWKIQVMVKEGCTHATSNLSDFCDNWREEVVSKLKESKPDLVVMESTHANLEATKEELSKRDQKILKPLVAAGIPIMGIRSTPRFSFFIPECIAANADYQEVCGIGASEFYLTSEEFSSVVDESQFVELVDLTSTICPDGFCSPVDKNVIRYVDEKHFTKSYSTTLADDLEPYLLKALGLR